MDRAGPRIGAPWLIRKTDIRVRLGHLLLRRGDRSGPGAKPWPRWPFSWAAALDVIGRADAAAPAEDR